MFQLSIPALHDESMSHSAFTTRLFVRSYNDFLLLTAWLVITSLGLTILGLYQADGLDGLLSAVAALLASAAITAIIAVAATILLQFTFQPAETQYERLDFIMSWVPLFLVYVVTLEATAELLLWYTNKSPATAVVFFALLLLISLVAMIILCFWVRKKVGILIDAISER